MPHRDGGIRGLQIPLIADKTMFITKNYGVLNEDEGIPYRYVRFNSIFAKNLIFFYD
jgi:alkyl hydroperoxide reductase subunit AhpC